jgi:AcrR family transcriptional regulator
MSNHDAHDPTGLPASIEAAWGLRERSSRGPRRGLSLELIVDAGVKIASTEGLSAVSMGRVARELGASTMSLYRYVSAKDELLALMIDAAGGLPPEPQPGEDWRAGLTRWARGYLAALRRHPWAIRVPISGPPVTPNQIAWLEDGLRAQRDTGLTEQEKASVVLLCSGFVRNHATLTADLGAGLPDPTDYGALLSRLIDPARFPATQAAIAAGAFSDEDDDDFEQEFAFGLERLLDGVEALVRSRNDR